MEPRTKEQVAQFANVAKISPERRWETRRRRLTRLADILDAQERPVRLFTEMECFHGRRRRALRELDSPLTIAFNDAAFRAEGLDGDSVGDGMNFFALSMNEAHHLLCDCGYDSSVTSSTVATRARAIARKRGLAELWSKTTAYLARWR